MSETQVKGGGADAVADPTMVIYHADCIDGFGAAWAAWKKYGDAAQFVPAVHGNAPPDVSGAAVFILDFSYTRPVLEVLADKAASLEVVDHHKTAQENLAGFPGCTFDLSKSGAVLAWERFHPGTPVPPLLLHVQDKDLWQWELDGSAEITCALRGHPFTFENWSMWVDHWEQSRATLMAEGGAILRYQSGLVDSIVAGAVEITVAGHRVLAANTAILQSEVAGRLAKGRAFGVAWFEENGRRYHSLRSRDGGIDVADVAQSLGGGGHARASGFTTVAGPVGEPEPGIDA